MGAWPRELTYLEVLARIWSCFRILGAQGPVACALSFNGGEKQGGQAEVKGKADPFWTRSLPCWSDGVLYFATNKGFSCASPKSWIFNSFGFSGSFRNLVGSAFSLTLGASYAQKTLFFSLFWIQGSIEAKRINVSCSCVETKVIWLVPFR